MGEFDQSVPLLEESLQQRRLQLPEDDPEILGRLVTLGSNCCEAGQFERGLALITQVREKGVQDPHPAWVRTVLLKAYLRAGRPSDATVLIRERVNEARSGLADGSPQLAAALLDNGKLLVEAKEFEEAETLLLEAYDRLQRLDAGDGSNVDEPLKDVRTALLQLYEAWCGPSGREEEEDRHSADDRP